MHMVQIPVDVLLSVCAWCRRVKDAAGEWVAAEPGGTRQPVTHGICPQCERQTLDAAERSRGGRTGTDRGATSGDHHGPECCPESTG